MRLRGCKRRASRARTSLTWCVACRLDCSSTSATCWRTHQYSSRVSKTWAGRLLRRTNTSSPLGRQFPGCMSRFWTLTPRAGQCGRAMRPSPLLEPTRAGKPPLPVQLQRWISKRMRCLALKRPTKRRVVAAIATSNALLMATLTGCASIDKQVQVEVRSYQAETFISIAMPTRDLSFNWHAAAWTNGLDRYEITIPRGKDQASGAEIRLAVGSAGTNFVDVDPVKSSVSLQGRVTCKISIALFSAAGTPYKVNGTYESNGLWCQR